MPQLSPEELRAAEAEANYTVHQVLATAVALYLCMSMIQDVHLAVAVPVRMSPSAALVLTSLLLSSLRCRHHLEDVLNVDDYFPNVLHPDTRRYPVHYYNGDT